MKGQGQGAVVVGNGSAKANGYNSYAEGVFTKISRKASHVQGFYNYSDLSFLDVVGVGNENTNKNASVIYVNRNSNGIPNPNNTKNGYQYLLGVGGYQGQDIAEGMKSVQEVIADLEKGVAATETMTVEDIREIMSA